MGSEMCIRDSTRIGLLRRRQSVGVHLRRCARTVAGGDGRRAHGPRGDLDGKACTMMSALLIALAAACAWLLTPGQALQRLDAGPTRRTDGHRRGEQYPTTWRAVAAIGVVGACLVGVPDVPALALVLGGATFLATGLLRKRVSHRREREEMPDTLDYLCLLYTSDAADE